MNFKATHHYSLAISLTNKNFKVEEIAEEIEEGVKTYNNISKQVKIKKYGISEGNLLLLWIDSDIELSYPMKSISLLSKLIITEIKEKRGEKTLNEIIKNKSLFKLVEEQRTSTNLKLTEGSRNNNMLTEEVLEEAFESTKLLLINSSVNGIDSLVFRKGFENTISLDKQEKYQVLKYLKENVKKTDSIYISLKEKIDSFEMRSDFYRGFPRIFKGSYYPVVIRTLAGIMEFELTGKKEINL